MRRLVGRVDIETPLRIKAKATYTFAVNGEQWSGVHVRKRKRGRGWRLYLYYDADDLARVMGAALGRETVRRTSDGRFRHTFSASE